MHDTPPRCPDSARPLSENLSLVNELPAAKSVLLFCTLALLTTALVLDATAGSASLALRFA